MKKIAVIFLSALLLVSLVACGGGTGDGSTGGAEPNNDGTSNEAKVDDSSKKETPKIAAGDTISDERAEITLHKIEFSYDVLPDDTSSLYTHYAADSGKVYIHIDVDVKNIQKQDLSCDEIMNVSVDYNDGYEYTGFPVPEDSSMGFGYASTEDIEPLTTQGVRYLVECPQEVADSQNPVKVIFDLNGTEYEYNMR